MPRGAQIERAALVWNLIRRHPAYRDDFTRYLRLKKKTGNVGESARRELEIIRQRWGLYAADLPDPTLNAKSLPMSLLFQIAGVNVRVESRRRSGWAVAEDPHFAHAEDPLFSREMLIPVRPWTRRQDVIRAWEHIQVAKSPDGFHKAWSSMEKAVRQKGGRPSKWRIDPELALRVHILHDHSALEGKRGLSMQQLVYKFPSLGTKSAAHRYSLRGRELCPRCNSPAP